MTLLPAILALADGRVFEGVSIGSSGHTVGELVFNTSMTGYQEILSDPSYHRQIVTLTVAHVGNTGTNQEDMESTRPWACGLVIHDCPVLESSWRSSMSLPDWLKKHHIVAISGVDTRALTRHLRDHGAMSACISTVHSADEAIAIANKCKGLVGQDLTHDVGRSMPERWDEGRACWSPFATKPQTMNVVVYDFGVKHQILRILQDLGCHITLVPARVNMDEVLALNPDGIVLSNGPGDPAAAMDIVNQCKEYLNLNIPMFGICLGHQILALALGAKTVKMKFGHHGANHPVQDSDGRVAITSQNHGFMVDEASLPECIEVTHRSLFDDSIQGFKHRSKPVFAFQGHPEAGPGPHDIEHLFNQFINMMMDRKSHE